MRVLSQEEIDALLSKMLNSPAPYPDDNSKGNQENKTETGGAALKGESVT